MRKCGNGGGHVSSSLFALGAPLRSLGNATGPIAVVHVAYDGGEVAVADAHLAATGVDAKAAFGVLEVLEPVAAESPDERLARTRSGHRVLGVDGLEEETN